MREMALGPFLWREVTAAQRFFVDTNSDGRTREMALGPFFLWLVRSRSSKEDSGCGTTESRTAATRVAERTDGRICLTR